jgi:hypothetical protein
MRESQVRKPLSPSLDAPGAGTAAGQGTWADSMNSDGLIAGYYSDASGVNHGFVRAADGTITTFDVSKAGTAAGQGTYPQSINKSGFIAGFYVDARGSRGGFVRGPSGAIQASSWTLSGCGLPDGLPPGTWANRVAERKRL